MTKTTRTDPPSADGGMAKEMQDARLLLTKVRSTLADLLATVVGGDGSALKDAVLKQSELESALKRVFDAEQKYHDWAKRNGGSDASDIDYDAIRDQIGCRLARLRDCCQEG